jgi:hypothetical protein
VYQTPAKLLAINSWQGSLCDFAAIILLGVNYSTTMTAEAVVACGNLIPDVF